MKDIILIIVYIRNVIIYRKSCSKGGTNNINNCNECIYGNLIKTGDSASNCCSEDKPLWYLSSGNFYCIPSCIEVCRIFI